MRRRIDRESGFSIVEVTIALTLLAVIAFNVAIVMRAASTSSTSDTAAAILEDRAQTALRRIAYSIMSADRSSLLPTVQAPLSAGDIRYQINLGIDDEGTVVWADPEMIELEDETNKVVWKENPDKTEERRIVWGSMVRPMLEGELLNGVDDNGNGLIDEKGLCFVIDRNAVTIRLTMERTTRDGQTITRTVEATATCRNPTGD